jgi:hypothetical protein
MSVARGQVWKRSWSQSYDFLIYSYNASVFASEKKIIFVLKTRYAIISVVNFYNPDVVTRDRRIGSFSESSVRACREFWMTSLRPKKGSPLFPISG